ncbi:MAG: hypothetical protein Q7J34_02365 [Bacteroidales bacterium]|nr:hypothetical protein [Bacteroidales bacterium]
MKKILVLLSAILILVISGCGKDDSETTPNNEAIIAEVFKAGMSWNTQKLLAQKSTIPINIQVENTVVGPEGGSIHVLGSITGSMTIDDQTGAMLGGIMLLGLTETINDYAFLVDGKKYTMNGAPYLSLTGTFTLLPGGATFGTASSMQYAGGIRVIGPAFDQTINIQITIIINTNGTGGTVSGTIDGKSVNYTF